MEETEKEVILMLADISGYTRFMVAHKTSLYHAQVIITELIQTIIQQIEIPLEVSKLEGDAVFFYAIKSDNEIEWAATMKEIGGKLLKFFDVFSDKIHELSESNTCKCIACKNIDKLKLKIVVHSGVATFFKIDRFNELSGVDVIIAHRLLKNSVKSDEYILMSEKGYMDIEFPRKLRVKKDKEAYDEIGTIRTFTFFPDIKHDYFHNYSSLSIRLKYMMRKVINSMLLKRGWKKLPKFLNLPQGPEEAEELQSE